MLAGNPVQRLRLIGAACLVLIPIVTLICWVLLRYQRNIVLICCLVSILIFFLFYRNSNSYKKEVRVYLCILTCYLIALLGLLNLSYSWGPREFVEVHRFNLLSSQYRQAVKTVEDQIIVHSDVHYEEILSGRVSSLLTVHGSISYSREDDQAVIYFPTDVSFFDSYGYVYQSSNNSLAFTFKKIVPINENWYYAKLY